MAQKKYARVVKAATAETASKFRLAEALALDIPPRNPGPSGDEEPVDVYLNQAREAIVAAGGEERTIETLKRYRCTALWVSGGVRVETHTNFAWVAGASFSSHDEARANGLTLEKFTALDDKRVDAVRAAAGNQPKSGSVSRIAGWTGTQRVDIARELLADPDVTTALALDGLETPELYCKSCRTVRPVRPGGEDWECMVCGSGLVPLESESIPSSVRHALGIPVSEGPLAPPVFPAGLTEEDAREAVEKMSAEDRALLARQALADEGAAELAMADPDTREDTLRAAMRVSEQANAGRTRPQPSGPTPAERSEDEHWASLGNWQQVSDALKAEAVHLQSSELLAADNGQFRNVILGYIARTRSQLDLIESITSGGGVSDEALAKQVEGDE